MWVSLVRNYATVKKGVEDIVNGKILEYEAKTIFQDGWREGYKQGLAESREEMRKQGFAEGYEERRDEIVTAMLRERINIDMVAQIAEMTVEQVMAIGKKAAVL